MDLRGHRVDLVTYAQHAGPLVAWEPRGAAWPGWNSPARRGWYAQVVWLVVRAP